MAEPTQASALRFAPELEARFQKMLPHYPVRSAVLIPTLHLALKQWGHLSDEVVTFVAEKVGVAPSEVLGVISFYTMLHREPLGKYNIQVCQTLSCALAGAEGLVEHLEKKLGIKVGETTPDGLFSLSTAECLASCGTAPVIQVNVEELDENLTFERVDQVIERCRKDAQAGGK